MFTSTTFASILPEILVLVIGILILIVEPFWKEEQRRNVGWLTAGGLLIAMIISLLFGQPGEPTSTLGGMVRFDWLGFFFNGSWFQVSVVRRADFNGHAVWF